MQNLEILIVSAVHSKYVNNANCFSFFGTSSARPSTGVSPLDPAGGFPPPWARAPKIKIAGAAIAALMCVAEIQNIGGKACHCWVIDCSVLCLSLSLVVVAERANPFLQ